MADRVLPGPVESTAGVREAVCIHTRKIFDSCRDKDCVTDLRVYPLGGSQAYIDGAISVRPRSAELLHVIVNVDEITFNRGFYTVDAKFFYKVGGDVFPGCHPVTGIAVFDKRVILFGSESGAKIYSSDDCGHVPATGCDGCREPAGMPIAVVEAVDPVALGMKLLSSPIPLDPDFCELPESVAMRLGDELPTAPGQRSLYVTLGQFSIIRLERDTQLLIPAYDYCIPHKECVGGDEDDPCTLFGRISFPIDEFFPPDNISCAEEYREIKQELG